MKSRKNTIWNVTEGVPYPLGITRYGDGVNFAIEVQKGHKCELLLYQKGEIIPCQVISDDQMLRFGRVLYVRIEEFRYENYEYKYRIDGVEYLDPYTRSITGKRTFGTLDMENADELRCDFFEEPFDWENDEKPCIPFEQTVMYCLHVRGFTKHASSHVPEADRGTFQGILDKLPYLLELGINQLEMMPVYEFVESILPEDIKGGRYTRDADCRWTNYWGYGKNSYYMAVKKEYASGTDERLEFCRLVRELHRNGIRVILEFYFPEKMRVCDMIECLRFWAMEYHVDGFHVTGAAVPAKELAKDPVLADCILYCAYMEDRESETAGDEKRSAVFAVDYMTAMRSFLKGDSGRIADAAYYMRRAGSSIGYVNYFACHDGFTMCDMVSYDYKHNEANEEGNEDGWDYNYSWNCGVEGKTRRTKVLGLRLRQMKNAWMLLLLSQGIPAMLAGDELCNSQKGNNNAYCQDNETGWLNWKCPKYYGEIREFVKKLIRLRKEHPVFCMKKEPGLSDEAGVGYPAISYHGDKAWYMDYGNQVYHMGILYCGEYAKRPDGQSDDYFYLLINMDWKRQRFALPKLPKKRSWQLCLSTGSEEGVPAAAAGDKNIEVAPRTIELYIGRKG